jgi:polar amino acid transport system ATP-binding protein
MKIKATDLRKRYGATQALNGIDLDLAGDVSVLAMIGPSGGGKSTLLRVLGGLEIPDHGTVEIEGVDIDFSSDASLLTQRRRNGFLFQSFNLFPHKTALQNIVMPLEIVHGFDRQRAMDTASDCLERFGLRDHADKLPAQLSGGQQQRAAIARAVAPKPGLLFLDEPTSALDPEMTGEVLDLVAELKSGGQNIVLSTHEMGFAREVADEIAFLSEGEIIEQGRPSKIFGPDQGERLRTFLSRVMRY